MKSMLRMFSCTRDSQEAQLNRLLNAITASSYSGDGDIPKELYVGLDLNQVVSLPYIKNTGFIKSSWVDVPLLHYAVIIGSNPKVIKGLLDNGATITNFALPSDNEHTGTILHNAVYNGLPIAAMDVLFAAGVVDVNAKNASGNTVLDSFINRSYYNKNNLAIGIRYFLAKGAVLSDQNIKDSFALAKVKPNSDMLELLDLYVEKFKPDLSLFVPKSYATVLHLLALTSNSCVCLKYQPDGSRSVIQLKDIAREIINLTEDSQLDVRDSEGRTPLSIAAGNKYDPELTVLKLLLEKNTKEQTLIDINSRDNNGLTPIMHAISEGNYRVYQALVLAGADLKAKANDNRSLADFISDSNLDDSVKDQIYKHLMMSLELQRSGVEVTAVAPSKVALTLA